jgi:hypothetical protein
MSAIQQILISYSANGTPPPPGSWILATGFWDDAGFWDDSATWID